ncbi:MULTISPECIES: ABC transporter ATP-binding protein/permease [Oxalobacteraceae]|uniref:ABC transporter ATP-binding protein/permease n=1 Tax=Herminiimonas sp. Marseille-P9896 TaxID=2742211 RepID=UPI00158A15BC|nr:MULTISPECIES: ABC transporter ATP-binding protein/permease [Oxalobacteraceae]
MPKQRIDWRAVWQLIKPYWVSEEKWKARGLLFVIVALALAAVYLEVLFNTWNREFYNALETKNYKVFTEQLWRFSYLAFTFIAVAIYRIYLTQSLQMRWRMWLTRQYMDRWLQHQAYYRIEQTGTADNPDQRIAEDLNLLTSATLSLTLGLLSSVVTLISFIGILWSVSGPISFMLASQEITIPGYMVWFAIAYAGVGSLVVGWVGWPLVSKNYFRQRFEADFRFGLIRVRENAEAVALYRGETEEAAQLGGRFQRIRDNWWGIMRTTKSLNLVSTFYSQFANIFPFLMAAPRYFSGAITLGGLMQISSAFGQVQGALSWFISAFSDLAEWKASVNRLAGFHAAVDAAHEEREGVLVTANNVGAILIDRLILNVPNGPALTKEQTADIQAGQRILVAGPSGCGKSTLIRAIAGVWPYGAGSIEVPQQWKLLFLPQKSYLPIGTLRAAVAYPASENTYTDLAIKHYFDLCKLSHMKKFLDHSDNWSQRLSPGEQQRLAFVRALLTRPDALFLDEASSALDTETEELVYQLILQELPDAVIVSVAHRESVAKYHKMRWQFVADGIATADAGDDSERSIYTIQHMKPGKA